MHYLHTASIGDFIAWLGFVPVFPTKITFASCRADSCAEICYLLGIPCEILDSSKNFDLKCQVEARHGELLQADASNGAWFEKVTKGEWSPQRNPFENIVFPRVYAGDYDLFCPITLNDKEGRNLTKEECELVIANATNKLVVVNKTKIGMPQSDKIINLSGMTNMHDALSCVAHCNHYWGCDTWASCACALFRKPQLVKSINPYWYLYRKCYTQCGKGKIMAKAYYTQQTFDDYNWFLTASQATLGEVDSTR